MVVSSTNSRGLPDAPRPVLGEYQRLPAEQLYVRALDLGVRT
jgi:hypothetical protein